MFKYVIATLAAIFIFNSPAIAEKSSANQSAFERVKSSNTLRCGYIILPPEFNKDINTGKFSGISYDITTEIVRRLGLKVEWVEEVSFPTMAEGLRTGRYDAVCFSLYRYTPQAMAMDYTVPLFATPTYAFVRHDDKRFDKNLQTANNKENTIVTIDGEMSQFIAQDDFPDAKKYSLPQNTSLTDMLLSVEMKKADIAFANAAIATPYLKANPGKLKIANEKKPLRLYSHGLVVNKGEQQLLNTLNTAITEMLEQGELDRILDKWHKVPGMIYRVKSPYQPESFNTENLKSEK